jgi:GntR family transcriptional regulator / MocR family aminotransferase
MGHSAAPTLPILRVDRRLPVPLHKQVYDGFRTAILQGDLRPGQEIPSSRACATDLRISRFPVLHAYAQLIAEGYFESRVGSGTFIAHNLPEQLIAPTRSARSSEKTLSGTRRVAKRNALYRTYSSETHNLGWGSFGVHQPALDEFPFPIWSSLIARHSRNPQASVLYSARPLGSERFREQICFYLRTARAVKCDPDQIMVVSGSQQALDITARVLLDPGDSVLIEEPGYSLERTVLTAAGCRLIPVPVDQEGMEVTQAIRRYPAARAAFVTPSHQFPMGSTMSASRRLLLLNWAQRSGGWIVEDDYDSEYRFDAQPIASLQGLDANSRVIYIGTFSKVLLPSLRVGYIVIPRDLVERFLSVRFAMDIFPAYLFQEVLADFMGLGHFGRHIRKMRQIYSSRRMALIESIQKVFGNRLEIHGAAAGMHVTVTLPSGLDDGEIAACAARERLWLWPLSPCYVGKRRKQGFVLGYGSTPESQIHAAVQRFHSIVTALRRDGAKFAGA